MKRKLYPQRQRVYFVAIMPSGQAHGWYYSQKQFVYQDQLGPYIWDSLHRSRQRLDNLTPPVVEYPAAGLLLR